MRTSQSTIRALYTIAGKNKVSRLASTILCRCSTYPVELLFRLKVIRSVRLRLLVALDEGYEAEVTDAVADQERDEGQPECYSTEVPLAEDRTEALKESEDEGIGESGKKRKAEDNRLGCEHDEL